MNVPTDFLERLVHFTFKPFRKPSSKTSDEWMRISEEETMKLFKAAAKSVPAYKDFLERNGVDPDSIREMRDIALLPSIDKDNYLYHYPYEQLVWDGNILEPTTIHATSGSTGEPTYFRRQIQFDENRKEVLDDYFSANPLTNKGPTLMIISFGMGIWSAGLGIYTGAYLSTNHNNLPISIVSPGINKAEVLKILKRLAPNFKQVIFAGYPPFVKDVIDDAVLEGIDLKKLNMRFIFTGEGLPEEFREYICEKTNVQNFYLDTMNTYGTSELGPTAIETPTSILFSRLLKQNPEAFDEVFGEVDIFPTLAQNYPYHTNFFEEDGELYFTGNNTIPLVKYRSGDFGGVISYNDLTRTMSRHGIDVGSEIRKADIAEHISEQPFVYVYARKNLATTLYGVLIYPDFVKVALLDPKLRDLFTGKFVMIRRYDEEHNQYLEVNLELRKGVAKSKKHVKEALPVIINVLREKSSEFRELSNNISERAHPRLKLWEYEDHKYFAPGANKHRWVIK